jgi:hypothetical protein
MKKAYILFFLLAITAGSLFAQSAPYFSITGRMDAWWLPFQSIVNDEFGTMNVAGINRDSNGNEGIRMQLYGQANYQDNVGLICQLTFLPSSTAATAGTGDNVFLWWQPMELFRLSLGKFVIESMRGRVGSHWCQPYTVRQYSPDAVFSPFNTAGINISPDSGNLGVLAAFNFKPLIDIPISLYFFVPKLKPFGNAGFTGQVNNLNGFGEAADGVYEIVNWNQHNGDDNNNGMQNAARVYERLQIALAYDITGIGLARTQFIGANPHITNPGAWNQQIISPRIEAAFNLTAVKGLNLDIGGKYFFPLNEKKIKTWKQYNFYDDDESLKWTNTGTVDGYLVRSGTYKAPVFLSTRASYKIEPVPVTVNISLDANFGSGAEFDEAAIGQVLKVKQGWVLNTHLWSVYDAGIFTLGIDAGLMTTGDYIIELEAFDTQIRKGGTRVGGGAYIQKRWGSSTVRAGVFYSAATVAAKDFTGKEIVSNAVLSIPVTFEYSF